MVLLINNPRIKAQITYSIPHSWITFWFDKSLQKNDKRKISGKPMQYFFKLSFIPNMAMLVNARRKRANKMKKGISAFFNASLGFIFHLLIFGNQAITRVDVMLSATTPNEKAPQSSDNFISSTIT